MNINKYLKKHLYLFVGTLVIIVVLITCATFAINNSTFNKSSYLTIQDNNIKVTYENNETELNMLNYSLSKEQGSISSPSNIIKIENIGTYDTKYKVVVSENSGSNFDITKLYYSIDDNVNAVPSDGILYIGNVDNNMEDIIDVKIWLGSDLITDEDLGSTLKFNLNVTEYNG